MSGTVPLTQNNPTATQAVLEEHETPSSSLYVAPGGLGAGWIDHLVPSHTAASWDRPTATHALLVAHDTLANWYPTEGFGVGWIDHLAPSQRSTSSGEPLPSFCPTAVHVVCDGQDTASKQGETPFMTSSELQVAPLGVRWIDHLIPVQRSATATSLPARFAKSPTAVQARGDAHDTPFRPVYPPSIDPGFGVRWIDQPDANATGVIASVTNAAMSAPITTPDAETVRAGNPRRPLLRALTDRPDPSIIAQL
jgi:hypothetical protein